MKTPALVLLVAALLAVSARDGRAATISIDMVPGGGVDVSRTREPGDTFTLNVLVADAFDLAGFQFDVAFDSGILNATSMTSGDIFGLDTFPVASTIGLGTVSFAETSLALTGLDVLAPAVLASIHFTVLAEGVTLLDLQNSLLADSLGSPIDPTSEADGELISRRSPPVPEPTILSLLLASGAVVFLRRGSRGRLGPQR